LTRLGRCLLAVAAGLAALAGCSHNDSLVLVEVGAGNAPLDGVVQLRVTMTVGMRSKVFMVPPAPGAPISFPASFLVEIDPFINGTITISVEGLDSTQTPIAAGTTVQDHFQISGQTVIPVVLSVPGAAAPPDGGGQ
jgi:hypothetical protein